MKHLIGLIVACLILSSAWAQTKISGKLTDDKGAAVPFANVFIKDSYDGASTAEDGSFSFDTFEEGDAILAVSVIGYESFEQAVKLEGKPLAINPQLKAQVKELDMVVISAGAFEASDEKKAVVLKPLDIVTTAGAAGDIFGAIQTLPGTAQIGEQEGLFVRGGSAAETKTIIDEMVVQNPFFSSVPDVPQRGRFSPFLFKGTVFSTGGYSALYGQALSSALVLNSADLADNTQTGIGLTMVGPFLSHTQRWENTSVSVSANYSNLEPFFKINKQLADWQEVPESAGGEVVFRQKTSKTGIFKLYGTYSGNRLALNTPNIENPDMPNSFALENTNIYLNSSYKEWLNENWSVFVGTSYSKDLDDIEETTFNLESDEELTQGKLILNRQLGKFSALKFGGEVHSMTSFGQFDAFANDLEDTYSAGFVEGDIFISSKLATRVGLRVENSELLNQQNIAPRTSLAYKTGENSQMSLAYGHFYQTPENQFLYQLENLDYERADHYIINYQRMNNDRTFRIEFYDKEYSGLVKSVPDSAQWLNNSGEGYARGFDIFWRDKKTIRFVDYWISYSYLDTKRNYRDFPIEAQPTFTSTHTFSLVYKHWISKWRCNAGATYTYASGRPYFNPNRSAEEFHSDVTPDYHNLSLNLAKLTSIKGQFTVLFLSVSNVLGIENTFGYRYSADGSRRQTVGPPNLRTIFFGCFISIGDQ